MKASELTSDAQNAIASMTEQEKNKAMGSLDCLVNAGKLITRASTAEVSDYVTTIIALKRAEAKLSEDGMTDAEYEAAWDEYKAAQQNAGQAASVLNAANWK